MPRFVPPDNAGPALAQIAAQKGFKVRSFHEFTSAESAEAFPDCDPFLADKRLLNFPLFHGDVYLGALVFILGKDSPLVLDPIHKKDLILISDAATKGIARIHRIQSASQDYGS